MKTIVLLLAFFFLSCFRSFSQDSCSLRISLLTCAPGDELYSTFGHTAIHVSDSTTGLDEVYNYGTFEFAPDFYYKFVKGKLLYALSVEDFREFLFQYQAESRSVIEQVLALNCGEKQKLYAALRTNAQPENRNYRYDFLFDNCTTRAKAIIEKNGEQPFVYKPLFPGEHPSFRNLIHGYLNRAHQDWSKLGIDLLLGARLDREATNEETMFLPDNLMKGVDSAVADGHSPVQRKTTILSMPSVATESYLITPFRAFALLLVIIAALMLTKKKWALAVLQGFDFFFFFFLGLVGVLLLFMWFGTDHALCANNYNLLWALPTNLVAVFFLKRQRRWVNGYFLGVAAIAALVLLLWAVLPQQLNPSLIPLVLLVVLRAWACSKQRRADKRILL